MDFELDADQLSRLMNIRSALTSVQEKLALTQIVTLLTVALEPGISVNELAERTGMPQQSASRHAAVLLGRYQNSLSAEPLEPLITQLVNIDDPRKRALFLTAAGVSLVRKFL
jgi:DNA-binding MarR family transcriptional regulator